jgi:hypothetical protein
MPASMAGCAQANISARRRSGISEAASAGVELLGQHLNLPGCSRAATAPGDIDHLLAGGGQEPRFRFRRTAIHRPMRQGRSERLGKSVLDRRHISRSRREQGNEFVIAATRDRICRAARLRLVQGGSLRPHTRLWSPPMVALVWQTRTRQRRERRKELSD